MYIKVINKKNTKKGKIFYQYYLCQSVRIEGKPRQRNVLYLGYDPLLEDKTNRSKVAKLLENKIYGREQLFELDISEALLQLVDAYYAKYQLKYEDKSIEHYFTQPPTPQTKEFEAMNVASSQLLEARSLGAEWLCVQLMQKLALGDFLNRLDFTALQIQRALISIISRAIFRSSEYRTIQYLQDCSALNELFAMDYNSLTHYHLYQITDQLYAHKEAIDEYLYKRFVDMFALDDKLVIYDLSNTHFEGRKQGSDLCKFGRNKQKRNDCRQVVFTGVINKDGFIRHSRIYEGNTADSATLKDMLADLERYSPHGVGRTVVMDAGLATEDNLILLRSKGLTYVCVYRQALADYKARLSEQKVVIEDKNGQPIELQLLDQLEGEEDRWMYVKSEYKARKESAIDEKLTERFLQDLNTAKAALTKKGGTKKIHKVYERIGRIKQKHKRIQARYTIVITEGEGDKEGVAIDITYSLKVPKKAPPKKEQQGVYFIRTNTSVGTEKQIWDTYNTIREVEATFRCLKSDLQIRPVYHQKDERIKAHLYLTILAYQLVNAIRFQLKKQNITYDWQNIVRLMNTQQMVTIELKSEGKTIGIRKPTRPSKEVLVIYKAVGASSIPKQKKKYVVYH